MKTIKTQFGRMPSDEGITEMVDKEFTKLTGLKAEEVHHSFPADRSVTIHTETRTWTAWLTASGHTIKKGSLIEEL